MVTSYNDKLILEVYTQVGITAEVKSGFASVSQKKGIYGLKLLADASLNSGTILKKGSTVYFDEEMLHSPSSGAKFPKKSSFSEAQFIVMDFNLAVAVEAV